MAERAVNNIRAFPGPLERSGGPPHNGDMEARVSKLEAIAETTRDRLAGVETRLTVIEQTMATKGDLNNLKIDVLSIKTEMHKELNLQTWRIIGVLAVVASAAVVISKIWH